MQSKQSDISLKIVGRRQVCRGFTLVEALVAVLILSVSLMGLVSCWTYMLNATITTDDRAAAYECARMVIERAHISGFVQNVPDMTTTPFPGNDAAAPATNNLIATDAATPNVAQYRFYSRNLQDLGVSAASPTTAPDGTRYLAVTSMIYSNTTSNGNLSNLPPNRPDLRLLLIDVKVYLVPEAQLNDLGSALQTDPLYDIQTCLTQGGL